MTLVRSGKAEDAGDASGGPVGPPLVAYATDAYGWALQQAGFLRAGRFDLMDADHVAEEITDVAHYLSDRLRSDLVRVLQHLLKWDYQPERRGRSWMLSIREHRRRVARHLASAPGLGSTLPEMIVDAYESARSAVLVETEVPQTTFPSHVPYSWEQIMTRPIEWPEQP